MVSVILASAEWCGPCRAYKPVLREICNENGISLQEIDVDRNPEFVQQHSISSVPVTMIFKNGNPVFKTKGAVSKSELTKMLSSWS